MMKLPFACLDCDHKFSTIDEYMVICPECKNSNVIVEWERNDAIDK